MLLQFASHGDVMAKSSDHDMRMGVFKAFYMLVSN